MQILTSEYAAGDAVLIPQAVCLHEEDAGTLWKHMDYRTGQPLANCSTGWLAWVVLSTLSRRKTPQAVQILLQHASLPQLRFFSFVSRQILNHDQQQQRLCAAACSAR